MPPGSLAVGAVQLTSSEVLRESTVGAAGVPRILFLQNAPHLVDAYAALPCDVLSVDWRVDIAEVQRRHPDLAVQGNIDPAILLGGPEPTRTATQALLRDTDARGHIVNLGHGIMPTTPLDSVAALVDSVHEAVHEVHEVREEGA